MRINHLAVACVLAASGAASAQERANRLNLPTYTPPPIAALQATPIRTYEAPEARQGVAVDAEHFYAVVNTVIARYDRQTGAREAHWAGPRGGLVRHLNSCFADGGSLWCANSNFPLTPMASSIEVFDAQTMTHTRSHSLGVTDEGSLTFFDRYGEGWIAGFAHYDGEGGHAFKNAAFSGIVFYDAEWRRTGGYALPASVLTRMAPHAASGGALGPDGLLYLLGHDLPEMYVLARPSMGPTLVHVATIAIPVAGQAFSWDRSTDRRVVFAIDRPSGTVRSFDIPAVTLNTPDARPFTPEAARR